MCPYTLSYVLIPLLPVYRPNPFTGNYGYHYTPLMSSASSPSSSILLDYSTHSVFFVYIFSPLPLHLLTSPLRTIILISYDYNVLSTLYIFVYVSVTFLISVQISACIPTLFSCVQRSTTTQTFSCIRAYRYLLRFSPAMVQKRQYQHLLSSVYAIPFVTTFLSGRSWGPTNPPVV